MPETLIATPANMNRLRIKSGSAIRAPGVFAYSPTTGEEYSASPGDCFLRDPDDPLLDSKGYPMILVKRRTYVVPA